MKFLYLTIAFALVNISTAKILTRGLSDEEEARAIHKLEKMYADLKKANQIGMNSRDTLSISNFLFKQPEERELGKQGNNQKDDSPLKREPIKDEPDNDDREEDGESTPDQDLEEQGKEQKENETKVLDPVSQEVKGEKKDQLKETKHNASASVPSDGKEKATSEKEKTETQNSKAAKGSGQPTAKDDLKKPEIKEGKTVKMQAGILVKTPISKDATKTGCSAARILATIAALVFAAITLF